MVDSAVLGCRGCACSPHRDEGRDRNTHRRRLAWESLLKALPDAAKRDAILWAAWAGKAWLHLSEIEHQDVRVGSERLAVFAEHALRSAVRLSDSGIRIATGRAEETDRLGVDGERRGGGTKLGCHVRERGAIGNREGAQTIATELDVATDHAIVAQTLGDGQDEIRCGDTRVERASKLEADHDRLAHRKRLSEHRSLGLDAANAPAKHAKGVDHRRMRIGTNERVRQRNLAASDLAHVNHGGEMLNVDLVDDAHARWHDTQPTEGTLAPAEEAVALAVALVLALDVLRERVLGPEGVDLDRVVDHEIDRDMRIDVAGVATHQCVRIAHRSKVGDRRNTSEVLQDHARRNKRH